MSGDGTFYGILDTPTRADQVQVSDLVLTEDYCGHVTRIEEMPAVLPGMVEAVRTEFTDEVVGLPVLKFEIVDRASECECPPPYADCPHPPPAAYYFVRFPNEQVMICRGERPPPPDDLDDVDETTRHDTSQRIPGRPFRECEVDDAGRCQVTDHYWTSGGPVANEVTP